MLHTIRTLSLVFTLLAALASPAAAQPYDLPLGREIKVTDTYLLKGTATQIARVTTVDPKGIAKLMRDDTTIVRIDAECEVAGVTEDGQEAVKLVTIRNAQIVIGGTAHDLVPTGTSLKATFSDTGTVITKDNEPLPMSITAQLALVIRSEGGLRTGKIMDPPGPVNVGDTWTMDTTAFKEMLGPLTTAVPKTMEGTSTFERIDTTGVRPDAVVTLSAHAVDAVGDLDGVTPTGSDIAVTVTVHAPLDTRYPLTRSTSRTRLLTEFGTGPGSANVEYFSNVDLSFLR